MLASERNELVRRVLSGLDSGCRELIHLHIGRRQTYREISERLGRSEAALRVQMHRCIQRARQALDSILTIE
jgi:RNA polymerase sigma factor (sigma-70 family)